MHQKQWWQAEKVEAKDLFTEVDRVYDDTSAREQRIFDACAAYGDISVFNNMQDVEDILFDDARMSHNVIATAIDALTAEITQSTVRPMTVTVGGTYDDRKKAEKLTQYVEARWDLLGVHDVLRACVRDSLVTGLGVCRVTHANELDPKNDQPALNRVFPANFLMDDFGSADAMPREFYCRQTPTRHYAADIFPEFRKQIMEAPNRREVFWAHPDRADNHVELIEAFHLASGPGKKDGKRVIAVRDQILVEEEHSLWNHWETPYKLIRGIPPIAGYWGEPLVMRAVPAQTELNKLLLRIQEAMHLISVPRVFVRRQSQIISSHLVNDIGAVIEHDGEPPVFHVPQSMSNDVFQHVDRLEQIIYRNLGISELSAVSAKPSGLDSGAALRTYSDVQTRRWINYVRAYERSCEELAREFIRIETDIAEKNPSHQVSTYHKNRKYDNVKWSEINLDPDRFAVRIYSASALPNTPAGKLQALEEMVKTGVIDKSTFIKMADVPDLEAVRNLYLAGDELLEEMFSRMLTEDAFYEPPDPGMDLEKATVLATLSAYRGILDGAPESRIEKLFQFADECKATMEAAMPPPEVPLGAQNAAAMAPPPMEGVPQVPGLDPAIAEQLNPAAQAAAGMVTAPEGTAAPFENV